jgi:catechol 2,3-dioxygenase-like lactoylglutathione lyase family enzyme
MPSSEIAPTGILETVLYADDLVAAEAFYRDVLGLTLHGHVPGRHVFFRCGKQMLLIFAPNETMKGARAGALPVPAHGTHGQGHVCFRADAAEIETWRTHLQAKGVAIESDFRWPSGGRSIYFRDPGGNSIEFAEPRIWGLV